MTIEVAFDAFLSEARSRPIQLSRSWIFDTHLAAYVRVGRRPAGRILRQSIELANVRATKPPQGLGPGRLMRFLDHVEQVRPAGWILYAECVHNPKLWRAFIRRGWSPVPHTPAALYLEDARCDLT